MNVNRVRAVSFLLVITLLSLLVQSVNVAGCKDVMVAGDATSGDFNLFMKVRDPSRPGPQVLCIINRGYTYKYHFPGIIPREKEFVVSRKFIGVVTKGDAPPDIVKPGMALSDAGVAYGDADSPSIWRNPLRSSWDDFDWIRYACQSAGDEEEAVELLKEVVEMHAPGISENLFVVGPRKAYVMEADALRYSVKEVEDLCVMSNYPKDLWKYNIMKRFFIARSFESEKEKIVRKGSIIRLGGLLGVRINGMDADSISVMMWPSGEGANIKMGEGKPVGPFWVELINISGNKARVRVCYKYKEWENLLLERLKERYGKIDVLYLMNISRLDIYELGGIRGMTEGYDEGTAICKIPYTHYEFLSCMWFAPNQCSSIYIPVHICCESIYEPYTNGDAAELSVKLLKLFGRHGFSDYAERVEKIFVREVKKAENIAKDMIEKGLDPSGFLTEFDMELQRQAYLTELFAISLKEKGEDVPVIWGDSYSSTLLNFLSLSNTLDGGHLEILGEIAKSIARLKLLEVNVTGNRYAERIELFHKGIDKIEEGDFEEGFIALYHFIDKKGTELLHQKSPNSSDFMAYVEIVLAIPLLLVTAFCMDRISSVFSK